jgi:hypothetical protein
VVINNNTGGNEANDASRNLYTSSLVPGRS